MFTSTSNSNNGFKCVSILLIDDDLVEENETFIATLTVVNIDKIVGMTTMEIVILDDDG